MEDSWFAQSVSETAKSFSEKLEEKDIAEIARRLRATTARNFLLPIDHPAMERLELHVQAMMHRFRIAIQPSYAAKGNTSNVPVDMVLLYYLILPAVVCTDDGKFVNMVRSLRLPDSKRVMRSTELLNWLRTGDLPS